MSKSDRLSGVVALQRRWLSTSDGEVRAHHRLNSDPRSLAGTFPRHVATRSPRGIPQGNVDQLSMSLAGALTLAAIALKSP